MARRRPRSCSTKSPKVCRTEALARHLGDAAKGQLHEIRNLAVAKVAPDIEGEDMDGVKFKLSDYRGKVVMIDFWGDW